MAQTLIIAAISSRAYVQAAVQAGFEVIAIDAFCDVDTQLLAKQTYCVPATNGTFDADLFKQVLKKINISDALGVSIGAGFEAAPELLLAMPENFKPIFNPPAVIEQVKNPIIFFDFLTQINAPFPATQLHRPSQSPSWLQKQIGGSGGAHIKSVLPIEIAQNNSVYYQQQCAGDPHGCLFLADGTSAQIIGFHQQWCAPTLIQPHRFGGAVSQVDLGKNITNKIENYVQKITQHFGLRGLNNLDFLLDNNNINLLEINPRLSASLQLYSAKKGDIFAAHVQACLNQPIDWPVIDATSRAMQVVYANKPAHVLAQIDWPNWVCDIPQLGSHIPAGAPLCTVLASARTAKLAQQKLNQRVNDL